MLNNPPNKPLLLFVIKSSTSCIPFKWVFTSPMVKRGCLTARYLNKFSVGLSSMDSPKFWASLLGTTNSSASCFQLFLPGVSLSSKNAIFPIAFGWLSNRLPTCVSSVNCLSAQKKKKVPCPAEIASKRHLELLWQTVQSQNQTFALQVPKGLRPFKTYRTPNATPRNNNCQTQDSVKSTVTLTK